MTDDELRNARATVPERAAVAAARPTIVQPIPPMAQGGSPFADPFIGLEVGDGYAITSKLAEGGMGAVYIASQRDSSNRRWAIKVLLPELIDRLAPPSREEIWNRFEVEAKIALRIEHPHVIDVIGWGQLANGATYIKMELLRGANLRRWAAECHRSFVPADDVLRVMAQVCAALEQAHQMGVVHRDLKPENIFVCDRDDGSIFVKLLDFGIARVMAPEHVPGGRHTTVPKAMGTPGYWSPEQQFDPASVDARADIYALGVVVYEMLTAQLPGVGSLAPANTPLQVPVAWYEPLARALAQDPSRRPPSARAFLESFIQNTPQGAAIAEAACPLLYRQVFGDGSWRMSASLPPVRTPPPLGPSTLSSAAAAYRTAPSVPRRRMVAVGVGVAAAVAAFIAVASITSRGSQPGTGAPTPTGASAPSVATSVDAMPVLPPGGESLPLHVAAPVEDQTGSAGSGSAALRPPPPASFDSHDRATDDVAAAARESGPSNAAATATNKASSPKKRASKDVVKRALIKHQEQQQQPQQRLPTSLDGVGD